MLTINFKTNADELARGLRAEQQQLDRASVRALNTAARGLRTDTSRELRKRYPKLKNRDVLELVNIIPASADQLRAVVVVRGRPLSLMRFFASENKKRGGGVWVNVKGVRKFIPGAWVQQMKTRGGDDYSVIFVREGKGRYPVRALKTIDIPNAMNIREVREILDGLVNERFDKEFSRQLAIIGG